VAESNYIMNMKKRTANATIAIAAAGAPIASINSDISRSVTVQFSLFTPARVFHAGRGSDAKPPILAPQPLEQ
jgi:hypothetical protein